MLNEFGFTRRTYNDLVESMENKTKELFGENARTTSNSVLGVLIRVFAWPLSLMYELLERVYLSSFINSSTGVSLDRLASNYSITRGPASAALVTLEFTGQADYVIEEGVQFATDNMIIFEMIDVVAIDQYGQGSGQAVSVDYSDRANVAAGTITVALEPVEELYSVSNPSAASGGSKAEDDKSLRDRIKASNTSNPGPPVNGIISAVLSVPGVRMARLVENNKMEVDEYGNPPKTIHIFSMGGDRQLIGQAIFDSIASGIQTTGNESVIVSDIGGFLHTVYFDYATPVRIYAKIVLTINDSFVQESVDEIKKLVENYVNTLEMGGVVRYSYFYPQIYSVGGVSVATVEIGRERLDLQASDITLSAFESATIVSPDIEVIT